MRPEPASEPPEPASDRLELVCVRPELASERPGPVLGGRDEHTDGPTDVVHRFPLDSTGHHAIQADPETRSLAWRLEHTSNFLKYVGR